MARSSRHSVPAAWRAVTPRASVGWRRAGALGGADPDEDPRGFVLSPLGAGRIREALANALNGRARVGGGRIGAESALVPFGAFRRPFQE